MIVIVIDNSAEVVSACRGELKSRNISRVLRIRALGLYYESTGSIVYSYLTAVVTALYPPDLYGCRSLGGEGNYILYYFVNLRLTAKVKSLSSGIAVLELLLGGVDLGLCAVMNGEIVVGTCLFGITVCLCSCRHSSKIGRGVKNVGLLVSSRSCRHDQAHGKSRHEKCHYHYRGENFTECAVFHLFLLCRQMNFYVDLCEQNHIA